MCASSGGQIVKVKLLIENGADVNLAAEERWLVLINDCKCYNMVKQLLENGAKADLQNNNAWTPLMVATQGGHIQVVKQLLDHGANVQLQSVKYESALSLALLQGNPEMIALIEDKVLEMLHP